MAWRSCLAKLQTSVLFSAKGEPLKKQRAFEEQRRMKVLPVVTLPEEGWFAKNSTESDGFDGLSVYEINADKLILVLAITFGFILFLLLSLLCIFYFMGFMQNQFGWTWGRPMGRTISAPFFPDTGPPGSQLGPQYSHTVPPCYGIAHQC